jgi:uncharacterized membrane protein YcaP (DUF421 family)
MSHYYFARDQGRLRVKAVPGGEIVLKELLIITFRTILLYSAVLLLMRIMGKREVGKLSLFDLVVAIMIAELAAIPMEDTSVPLHHGLLPITILVLLEIGLSIVTLKSQKARRIIEGTPSIIIEQGKIMEEQMRRMRYNIDDMITQMRDKGTFNIDDVEYAILETNGKLSIIPKAAKRPVTPEDLGMQPSYEGLPIPLVVDGAVQGENLALSGKNYTWLEKSLAKNPGCNVKDVLYATLDTKGKLIVFTKGEKKKTP